jgi:hypothetical protein
LRIAARVRTPGMGLLREAPAGAIVRTVHGC